MLYQTALPTSGLPSNRLGDSSHLRFASKAVRLIAGLAALVTAQAASAAPQIYVDSVDRSLDVTPLRIESDDAITLPAIEAGQTKTFIFRISDVGDQTLHVDTVAASQMSPSIENVQAGCTEVAGQYACSVSYDVTAAGNIAIEVLISSNDPAWPFFFFVLLSEGIETIDDTPPTDDQFEDNDTPDDATPLTSVTGGMIAADDDWFRFELSATSILYVRAAATHMAPGDIDILVFDETLDLENPLASVLPNDTLSLSLQVQLNPGTYYLLITPKPGLNSSYFLSTTISEVETDDTTPNDDQFEENDTHGEATPLTSGTWELVGNDADWFRFDVSATSILSIQTSVSGADDRNLDLKVFDEPVDFGNPLASSSQYNTSNEAIEVQLEPGTYFAVIMPRLGLTSPYSLTTTITEVETDDTPPPDDQFEENDTHNEAKPLTTGTWELVGDDDDWFRFEVSATSILSIQTNVTGVDDRDLDLYVFDEPVDLENPLVVSDQDETSNEAIEVQVEPGTYFAVITPHMDLTSPYELTVNVLPLSGAGISCDADSGPICGVDGTTYEDECEADLAGTSVDHSGPCVSKDGGLGDDEERGPGGSDEAESPGFDTEPVSELGTVDQGGTGPGTMCGVGTIGLLPLMFLGLAGAKARRRRQVTSVETIALR